MGGRKERVVVEGNHEHVEFHGEKISFLSKIYLGISVTRKITLWYGVNHNRWNYCTNQL
jgi:hypothetical protein